MISGPSRCYKCCSLITSFYVHSVVIDCRKLKCMVLEQCLMAYPDQISIEIQTRSALLWYIMPYSPLKFSQHLWRTYHVHLQVWRITRARWSRLEAERVCKKTNMDWKMWDYVENRRQHQKSSLSSHWLSPAVSTCFVNILVFLETTSRNMLTN
jgi:hypothetical protein